MRRKRSKRMICAQTRLPEISVAQVARQYDVNANQVFSWLKDPKFAAAPKDEAQSCFLPVEVVKFNEPGAAAVVDHSEMVVELTCDHPLQIAGSCDPDALAALIRKLCA